jgi:D-alanyl-D-alanine carboxypeptidase/D-alanyl-D-alanine-endopeptidase (penicillin-binding protein 4)
MRISSFVVLFLFFHRSFAQQIDSLALSSLTDATLALQNSEFLENGTLAFCVKSTKDDRTILALNYNRSVPSASTLKLVSTASALSVLGGDFSYKTYLEFDGTIEKDTLRGNIYVRGTGDPTLGSERFSDRPSFSTVVGQWEAAIKKAGIRHITGSILADPTYFDAKALPDSWIWGDLGNYYGAGVQGLNINENSYRLFFRSGKSVGDPVELVKTEPELPNFRLTNKVTTEEPGTGDQVLIYASPLSKEIVLTGTIPKGTSLFSVKGALPDGAFQAAYFLTQALRKQAILTGSEPGVLVGPLSNDMSPRTTLDEQTSPSLKQICQQTNWWSVNLFADGLLKTTGKRLVYQSDYDNAVKAIKNYWISKGIDMQGFFVKDGSGLSPSGSLTVNNLTGILNAMTKDRAYRDFYESIAVLGQHGTVRNLGKGTRAAGNVRAKSGSIEGTRAYAGYVTTKSGEQLSFAMIAHKYDPESSKEVSSRLVQLMILLAEL